VIAALAQRTFTALFTGARPRVSDSLTAHYGGDLPQPALSAGLLTSGAFLSVRPRPTQRGLTVTSGLLCNRTPEHPANLDGNLGAGTTGRERITAVTAPTPICNGCHQTFDPAGFALEAFDEQGRLTGFDTSGSVRPEPASNVLPVAGPSELGQAIFQTPAGLTCAMRHYLEYALDRELTPSTFAVKGARPNPGPQPTNPAIAPEPPQLEPEARWVDCLVRMHVTSQGLDLTAAAEAIATSNLMRTRARLPRYVNAIDTSVDPLEHAFQETRQLKGAFQEASEESVIQRYADALLQLQATDRDQPQPAGEGGAGGAGGESGAPSGGAP
jgi:hypothetical protein